MVLLIASSQAATAIMVNKKMNNGIAIHFAIARPWKANGRPEPSPLFVGGSRGTWRIAHLRDLI
jgi:hypothetical protein